MIRDASLFAGVAFAVGEQTPKSKVTCFTDYGPNDMYRHAPQVPLHRLKAILDLKLVPPATLSKKSMASAASSKSGDGVETVLAHEDASAASLEKSKPRREAFFDEMVAKRRELSNTFAAKFSRFMEKSGDALDAAAASCDVIYQEIYTREFNAYLDNAEGTGKIQEYDLRVANALASSAAVGRLALSGSMNDRNYAKFLSTFRLNYVKKTPVPPSIPPRIGAVAYRPDTLSPRSIALPR